MNVLHLYGVLEILLPCCQNILDDSSYISIVVSSLGLTSVLKGTAHEAEFENLHYEIPELERVRSRVQELLISPFLVGIPARSYGRISPAGDVGS